MTAESPAKDMPEESEGNSARGLRAHALGLIGANFVVGSLFLCALPLLARLWHQSAPGLLQHLASWSATVGVVALIYDAVALAAMVIGIVLVVRAARMLRVRVED